MALCRNCGSGLLPGRFLCTRCGEITLTETGNIGSVTKARVTTLDQVEAVSIERHVTGGPWDAAWGGGIVPTSVTLLGGTPGCLSGNTLVNYIRGARNGGRKISLRDMFLKFNGQRVPGIRGRSGRWVDLTIPTFLASYWPDGTVMRNRVVGVFEAGVKPVIRLAFSNSQHLVLTSNHRIITPDGSEIEAGDLKVGNIVLAQGTMKCRKGSGRRPYSERAPRIIVNTKYHPGPVKTVMCNEVAYEYVRVPRARLVVEAAMNDLSYDEFVHALKHNAGVSAKFKYLPLGRVVDVHHLDENTLNDDISNLEVLPHEEHARIHGRENIGHFHVDALRNVRVMGIRSAGREMTYDIQMESPAHNFAANSIFVHNSGKSTMLLQLASKCAELTGRKAYYLSAEQAAGEIRLSANRIKIPNIESFVVLSAMGGGVDIADEVLKEHPPALFIVDSISALCGKDIHAAWQIAKKYKLLSVKCKAPSFLVCHVNKTEGYAGLMALQHEVDTCIALTNPTEREASKLVKTKRVHSDEELLAVRVLAAIKNRYGSTSEDYFLKMTEHGLVSLPPAVEKKPKKLRTFFDEESEPVSTETPRVKTKKVEAPKEIALEGQRLVRKPKKKVIELEPMIGVYDSNPLVHIPIFKDDPDFEADRRAKESRERQVFGGEALKKKRAPMPKEVAAKISKAMSKKKKVPA